MSDNIISDINWQSLISSGIKSGLGSAGKTATEWALSYVLNAAFGYQSPEKKEKEELESALKNIQGELNDIDNMVNLIEKQIKELSEELAVDLEKELTSVVENSVNEAIANIQTGWKNLKTLVKDNTTSNDKQPPKKTSDATLVFAEDVVGTWSVPDSLTTIQDELLGGLEADDLGLLDLWTNTLILSINDNQADVKTSYGFLEQNFLGVIQWMYQGHSLCVAAEMRLALNSAISAGTYTPDEITEKVKKAGENYLEVSVTPGLQQMSHLFLQCVQRLILSQYMRTTSDPTTNKNASFAPFTSTDDVNYCLSRACLINWLMNMSDTDDDNPGIVCAMFYRPSQLSKGKGPALQPNPTYQAQSPNVFTLSSQYVNNWYKVVDFDDTSYTKISDYDSSDVGFVIYQWTTPIPPVNTVVGTTTPFNEMTPAYYDKTTLEPVNKASSNTVVFAFAADISSLYDNLIFNDDKWSITQSPSPSGKDSEYIIWQPSINAGKPAKKCGGQIGTNGRYKGDAITQKTTISYELSYDGQSGSYLYFYYDCSISIHGFDDSTAAGYASIPWEASSYFEIMGMQFVSIPEVKNPGNKTGGSKVPVSQNTSGNQMIPFDLSGGGQFISFNPTISCDFTIEKQEWYKDYDNENDTGGCLIKSTLSEFTLAWPQPTVSSS